MNENNAIATTDEDDVYNQPVVSGPNEGNVKNINAVGDDHPLVEETGETALKTQTESGAGEFLSDFIYEHDSAWVREWLQNEETACVRAAKLLVKMSDKYPDGWLKMSLWVDPDTGETVKDFDESQSVIDEYDEDAATLKEITVPRPIQDVLKAARTLGYDPTIVWDVYRDERKIITEDNGIGMTPHEFDKAFNTIFNSGSGVDGETGGMFGVGSESSALVHGNDGGAEVETRSRRPTKDGEGYDGFRAYSYLGGANALPGEVEEGFKGTRFNIPVQGDFDLSNLQEWVEEYTDKLSVPLLYREHDAGTTPVEEEYEATDFVDDYEGAPITIQRPGEFSVVAGPDVIDTSWNADDNDTFLVSMPIDRNNSGSINTFWNVVIQIHDEQGRVVSGPNRGCYSDGSKVFKTSSKQEVVGKLQDEDVMLPEPTGDRDRLQRDSESKNFFRYIESEVESKELEEVKSIVEEMKNADHPGDAIRDSSGDWKLFKKMVNYHGSYRVLDSRNNFRTFMGNRDEFPDLDDETTGKMYDLFTDISHCHNGSARSSRKSSRREKPVGDILAFNDPETIYMAASTGGMFTERFKVIENTYDDPEVIVIKGASKYDKWSKNFGFNILKEVPVVHSTDEESHDYDVPSKIHENNINTGSSSKSKADKVVDRALKIRTDDDNSSIDMRKSIKEAQQILEDGRRFGGHDHLVLFPRTEEANISDHYDFSKYAAIASVSKTEYEELADYDKVMTYSEYTEWSENALIATEDGAMTPAELIADDRLVVLTYRVTNGKKVVQLLSDENSELRQLYSNDIRDQFEWASILDGYDGGYRGDDVGEVPDDDKHDTLFAVACDTVLQRAEWAFKQLRMSEVYGPTDMVGLKLGHNKYKYKNPCSWKTLNGKTTTYKLMTETPNWDNDSEVYEMIPSKKDSNVRQMYLGFHDRDIDPTEKDPKELRKLVNGK